MPLTKTDIISKICNGTELTRKQSTETVEKIIEVIKSALVSGDEVTVNGFGKLSINEKNELRGVCFSTSEELKKRMNAAKR